MRHSRCGQDLNCRSWFVFLSKFTVLAVLTIFLVAEHIRAPLYAISAAELGLTALEVEANLERISQLVVRWNAILLLDEADVFLEKRNTHDLERNKLVSGASSFRSSYHE